MSSPDPLFCVEADYVKHLLENDIKGSRSSKYYVRVSGKKIYISDTILLFQKKGYTCASCNLDIHHFTVKSHGSNLFFSGYGIDNFENKILFTKDHIIPKSAGGSDSFLNLQVMCASCNIMKKDKILHPSKRVFSAGDLMRAIKKSGAANWKDLKRELGLFIKSRSLNRKYEHPNIFFEEEVIAIFDIFGLGIDIDIIDAHLVPVTVKNKSIVDII